ncbi:ABC transporter permease subunit [Metabacillus sp. KIGAM252]|uniref:ABC transporter permease subunit n=1 Tax=Metabacillus flavus TaxID=2823519 RepID=A0ABS5L9C6_9BACI|nr:ABC transporter permease subunit [Metabacillus flavus]MBS2967229.1 ABC transporter permease subunit [Metabacillus flavus]
MMNLVKNEWIKIFAKKSSWIYFILLAVFLIIMTVATAYIDQEKTESNWRPGVEQEIADLNQQQKDPKLDAGEKEDLAQQAAEKQFYLDKNVNPALKSNWQYANADGVALFSTVALFCVIIASTSVASEFSDGTIKQLLIRPHRRWKILLSKYISVVAYSFLLLLFLAAANVIAGTFLYGAGDFGAKIAETPMTFSGGEPVIAAVGNMYIEKILLFIPNLIMVVTISFMLSTLFKSQSMAVGFGIFVLFMNSALNIGVQLLIGLKQEWAKLLLFPHLELMQFSAAEEILPGVTLMFSLAVLLVYYIIFMAITFFFFQRKDVSI